METANLSRPFGKSGRSAFALLPQVLLVLGAGPLAERAFGDEDPGTTSFLSPRYSSVSATDRIAAKVDSHLDVFAAEAVGEHLAARLGELAGWLKQSPVNSDRVAALLADSFAASGWGGREEEVRCDSRIQEVRQDLARIPRVVARPGEGEALSDSFGPLYPGPAQIDPLEQIVGRLLSRHVFKECRDTALPLRSAHRLAAVHAAALARHFCV